LHHWWSKRSRYIQVSKTLAIKDCIERTPLTVGKLTFIHLPLRIAVGCDAGGFVMEVVVAKNEGAA